MRGTVTVAFATLSLATTGCGSREGNPTRPSPAGDRMILDGVASSETGAYLFDVDGTVWHVQAERARRVVFPPADRAEEVAAIRAANAKYDTLKRRRDDAIEAKDELEAERIRAERRALDEEMRWLLDELRLRDPVPPGSDAPTSK